MKCWHSRCNSFLQHFKLQLPTRINTIIHIEEETEALQKIKLACNLRSFSSNNVSMYLTGKDWSLNCPLIPNPCCWVHLSAYWPNTRVAHEAADVPAQPALLKVMPIVVQFKVIVDFLSDYIKKGDLWWSPGIWAPAEYLYKKCWRFRMTFAVCQSVTKKTTPHKLCRTHVWFSSRR